MWFDAEYSKDPEWHDRPALRSSLAEGPCFSADFLLNHTTLHPDPRKETGQVLATLTQFCHASRLTLRCGAVVTAEYNSGIYEVLLNV